MNKKQPVSVEVKQGQEVKDNKKEIKEISIGDLVIFFDDSKQWWLAEVLEIDHESDELTVHYYNTYSSHNIKGAFRPVYVDPKDGKEVYTWKPKPSFERYTSVISLSQVKQFGFSLTASDHLPSGVAVLLR